MSELTRTQCKAARAMLDWSQRDLVKKSGIGQQTIAMFEAGTRDPRERTLAGLRTTFERAGIEFIEANGGGPGVRLKRKSKS